MALEQGFVFGPAVVMGIILGLYEARLVYADEGQIKGSFSHSIHTIPTTIILVFLAMNVDFILQFIPSIPLLTNVHVIRAIIGIFAAIKLHAISSIAKGVTGMQERWFHTFIIAGLIVASPYLWEMLVEKIIPESVMKFLVFGGK